MDTEPTTHQAATETLTLEPTNPSDNPLTLEPTTPPTEAITIEPTTIDVGYTLPTPTTEQPAKADTPKPKAPTPLTTPN